MKNKVSVGILIFVFLFVAGGVAFAATEWTDDNTFTGIVNWFPNGEKIGQQGTGGVTFFNGTIVNETTTDEGAGIPVTFGDDVRIDGQIWRGEAAGSGDGMPVKIDDDLEVSGTITGSLAPGTIFSGEEDALDYGSPVKTTTKYGLTYDTLDSITMTTGANTMMVMFSGVFSNNTPNNHIRAFMLIDGDPLSALQTVRSGASTLANDSFVLSYNALIPVTAGEHTFSAEWNTISGTTATTYSYAFDVLELKN